MKKRPPETNAELIERVGDLFDQAIPETFEEADEELRASGIDPDEVGAEMNERAKQWLADSPLNWRTRAKKEREQSLAEFERFRMKPAAAPSNAWAAIEAILARAPHLQGAPTVRAHFHKLKEKASESDLESLLEELEFLERQRSGRDDTEEKE